MADKIRVLIVDDIAETRENIRRLLQFERDMEVVGGARTGKEAITMARDTQPHVVIMDINMPDMDGITATEAVLKELPEHADRHPVGSKRTRLHAARHAGRRAGFSSQTALRG